MEPARTTILAWLERRGGAIDDFAHPSRIAQLEAMLDEERTSRFKQAFVA